MRCQILTAVWGPWHTDKFISFNLPSLLAGSNLPEFVRSIETDYVIVTSKDDAPVIEQSSAYKALKKLVRTRIVAYGDRVFGHPIETHKKIWQNGYKAATKSGAFYITNPADMVWSDNSFKTIARHLMAGKKSIYAMFARVVDDAFANDADQYRTKNNSIDIPARTMIDLTIRNFHPFHAAYLRDSSQYPFHYEYVYWPIKGQGLLMRTFATTVLGFYPSIDSVTSNYTLTEVRDPNEVVFIDDSDDLCGVSLTPLLKDQNWYSTVRSFDIDELGAWWITFDGAAHLPLAQTKFHFHTGTTDSPEWRRAELASEFVVLQGLLSREIIRAGRILKDNGCKIGAELVASALYGARLRRRWKWRGSLDIFVPNDAALAPVRDTLISTLLPPGNDAKMIEFVSDHIAPSTASSDSGQNGTANDAPYHISETDIVKKIDLPFGNRLFILNRLIRPVS